MDPSVLSTGLPSLAAVLVLVGNIVMRWLELRDREAHRRAVLALSGNPKALEMLAQTPTAPKDINTGPVILLAVGAAAALMAIPTPQRCKPAGSSCRFVVFDEDGTAGWTPLGLTGNYAQIPYNEPWETRTDGLVSSYYNTDFLTP